MHPVWILTFSAWNYSTLLHNIFGNVNLIAFVMLHLPQIGWLYQQFWLNEGLLEPYCITRTDRILCHVLTWVLPWSQNPLYRMVAISAYKFALQHISAIERHDSYGFVRAQVFKINAKKYGMHFRATQVLSSLDGGSNLPPFSLIDIKMCRYIRRYSFCTGHFGLLIPTESILIPTGSLYTHRSQNVPPESKRHAHREKGSDCHETKSKHIDWTLGLKWDHRVWPWPWPWPWLFKVKYGICYISTNGGPKLRCKDLPDSDRVT